MSGDSHSDDTQGRDDQSELTQRQLREMEYHRDHAKRFESERREISFDILRPTKRSWQNASWSMYTDMLNAEPADKRVLVVGCGFGEDAIRLAKVGAIVSAFDISGDVLEVARQQAQIHNVKVDFRQLACEALDYADHSFDWIVARDILHHVEIPQTLAELTRVAKSGAEFFINEVYSHSITKPLRNNPISQKIIYPLVKRRIYQGRQPYITPDERKCDQHDIKEICRNLTNVRKRYFSMFSGRIFSPANQTIAKLDRLLLKTLGPAAHLTAGRIIIRATPLHGGATSAREV